MRFITILELETQPSSNALADLLKDGKTHVHKTVRLNELGCLSSQAEIASRVRHVLAKASPSINMIAVDHQTGDIYTGDQLHPTGNLFSAVADNESVSVLRHAGLGPVRFSLKTDAKDVETDVVAEFLERRKISAQRPTESSLEMETNVGSMTSIMLGILDNMHRQKNGLGRKAKVRQILELTAEHVPAERPSCIHHDTP